MDTPEPTQHNSNPAAQVETIHISDLKSALAPLTGEAAGVDPSCAKDETQKSDADADSDSDSDSDATSGSSSDTSSGSDTESVHSKEEVATPLPKLRKRGLKVAAEVAPRKRSTGKYTCYVKMRMPPGEMRTIANNVCMNDCIIQSTMPISLKDEKDKDGEPVKAAYLQLRIAPTTFAVVMAERTDRKVEVRELHEDEGNDLRWFSAEKALPKVIGAVKPRKLSHAKDAVSKQKPKTAVGAPAGSGSGSDVHPTVRASKTKAPAKKRTKLTSPPASGSGSDDADADTGADAVQVSAVPEKGTAAGDE